MDGDGFASIKGFNAGIATTTNQPLLAHLLGSLGIEAISYKKVVTINKSDSIRNAEQLPMFRHAVGRQKRLTQLVSMLDSMKGEKISEDKLETIMNLYRQGFSAGTIAEILWSKYGIAHRPTTLAAIIKRNSKK